MSVPFLDLKRQYNKIKDIIEPAINECMNSCSYVEGPQVKQFETDMKEYLNVKHVITCGSGTDALKIALKASGVVPGDEIITTAFSFFATAEAISAIGAIPVFVDIKETDYNIDVNQIEKKITNRTKAILPVHIFGAPADMESINKIAEKYNLKVIEDACQAIGSEYKNKKAGTLGDAGCFSFYPTKNLGAFGDGGMITTNDDSIAIACRALKAHAGGKAGYEAAKILGADVEAPLAESNVVEDGLYDPYKYYNYLIADNSRLDSMQAVILDIKLEHLDEFNQNRADIALKYNQGLKNIGLEFPTYLENEIKSCWHQYVVMTDEKEALIDFLGKNEIGAGSFYPVPLHLQKAFYALQYKDGDFPIAEKVCGKTVCLPIFPELTGEEQDYVIQMIKKYFSECR